jgi:hypothetical protein
MIGREGIGSTAAEQHPPPRRSLPYPDAFPSLCYRRIAHTTYKGVARGGTPEKRAQDALPSPLGSNSSPGGSFSAGSTTTSGLEPAGWPAGVTKCGIPGV